MNLILVDSNDIIVGKPLPWPLYDQKNKLLLDQGDIVRDDEHRDALLASGASRELSPEVPGNETGDDPVSAQTNSKQPKADKSDALFTFDDMKLKVEDKLQLEPPAQLARERFLVKVIGFMRGVSLLVTTPVATNGIRLQLREGEKVVMRSFTGQNAFGFACTVERVCKLPYEYLHLSFPDNIQGVVIRKAPRIKTHISAKVKGGQTGAAQQVSAIISDISAIGVSLDAMQPLGNKGDVLNLEFCVHLHNIDTPLSVNGVIRAIPGGSAAEATAPAAIRHGIEFQELQPNDHIVLKSMIYQQLIENPHLRV